MTVKTEEKTTCAWTLEVDADGIATLWMDGPDRVNLLGRQTVSDLNDRLDEIAARTDVKAVVVASKKPNNFIAGADMKLFAEFGNAAEATAVVRQVQSILQKLADLRVPTVAAIHGSCMGGGLELALACTRRLCSDSSETVLSLPEVQIGVLPGAGGTQRLPRLIGLRAALDMILTGKRIRPVQ
ncbi:MAG: enoyl-CoA hydratase-related protein, partial [Candidatus Xenobia bacterium]